MKFVGAVSFVVAVVAAVLLAAPQPLFTPTPVAAALTLEQQIALAALIAQFEAQLTNGAACLTELQENLDEDFFTCYLEGTLGFNGIGNLTTHSDFVTFCESDCIRTYARSLATLETAGCLPNAYSAITSALVYANLVCAQGGGFYCGEVGAEIMNVIIDGGALDQAACELINDAGYCLGTYSYYIDTLFDQLPEFVQEAIDDTMLTLDQIEAAITGYCSAYSVNVTENLSGTEAAASIGSSSGTTATAILSTVVVLLVTFFAVN